MVVRIPLTLTSTATGETIAEPLVAVRVDDLDALQERIVALTAALNFYGNARNYQPGSHDERGWFVPIERDQGERARQLLQDRWRV